jgi:hypothetical protein
MQVQSSSSDGAPSRRAPRGRDGHGRTARAGEVARRARRRFAMDGLFLLVLGVVLLISAAATAIATRSSWSAPLFAGAVAAFLAAAYQRWWTSTSFEGPPDERQTPVHRRLRHRTRARAH